MLPTDAASGFLLARPESHYFAVGHLDRDQGADCARRKGLSLHEAEPWLAPLLDYEG
jgi:5-methyltetrahydrofolate--homocysteine methyltransferase